MTSTELVARAPAGLPEKIEYAKFLAQSGLLPQSYRQQPANILYAYEYGELLGLHPMAAITGIHVIDGRPSISAGLMSALVRRAGHRIRVQSTGSGDQAQARCQITRSDDPSFTYSAVWTMDRAKQAGLLSKTNWRNYPEAMLKARAVSECARDACQEVLLGMQYTPDELGAEDDGGEVVHDGFPTGRDGSVALSQMTEDEKNAAGMMTRSQRVEHDAMRREGEPPPGRVEKLRERDLEDPWANSSPPPAETASNAVPKHEPPAPQPAGKAAIEKLDRLVISLDLGPADDVLALFEWLCGSAYTATRQQVTLVTSWLDDHLKAAQGDVAAASSAIWEQYRKANPQAGDDGA